MDKYLTSKDKDSYGLFLQYAVITADIFTNTLSIQYKEGSPFWYVDIFYIYSYVVDIYGSKPGMLSHSFFLTAHRDQHDNKYLMLGDGWTLQNNTQKKLDGICLTFEDKVPDSMPQSVVY